jgi:hypothetical protein
MRLKLLKKWDGKYGLIEAGTVLVLPHYVAECLLKDGTAVEFAAEPVAPAGPTAPAPDAEAAPTVAAPAPVSAPAASPHASLLSAP